jgi:hypothetical protein
MTRRDTGEPSSGGFDAITSKAAEDARSRQPSKGSLPFQLSPTSPALLEHFCKETVDWMLFSNEHNWVIYKHVIPLATSNELVLDALLAVSGVHMRLLQPEQEFNALEHYTRALRGLKEELAGISSTPASAYKVLLTTMILLIHCEVGQ